MDIVRMRQAGRNASGLLGKCSPIEDRLLLLCQMVGRQKNVSDLEDAGYPSANAVAAAGVLRNEGRGRDTA